MGPIEQELRAYAQLLPGLTFARMSSMAYACYFDAWVQTGLPLGWHPQADDSWPDLMSEAIEAAEALRL